jgi:transposase-like protein
LRLIKGKKYSYSDSSPGEKFLPKGPRRELARDYERLPQTEVRPACLRFAGSSYLVDETYVKVKGAWKYLYRAVDSTGQTIDFMLSAKRDTKAAKRLTSGFCNRTWRSPASSLHND